VSLVFRSLFFGASFTSVYHVIHLSYRRSYTAVMFILGIGNKSVRYGNKYRCVLTFWYRVTNGVLWVLHWSASSVPCTYS